MFFIVACNDSTNVVKKNDNLDSLVFALKESYRENNSLKSKIKRLEKTSNSGIMESGWLFERMHSDFILESNLPIQAFKDLKKHKDLSISNTINPFYQRGDFNGDCLVDIAISVQNEKGQRGILIVHQAEPNVDFLLGAGNDFSNGGNDFGWMDIWGVGSGGVFTSSHENEERLANSEYLYVEKSESAGGAIYWNGSSYEWEQHGD